MKKPSEKALSGFVAFAGTLADAAGTVARRYFRAGVEVIGKYDASPVTIADLTAEARMRRMFAAMAEAASERGHGGHVVTLSRSLIVPFLQFSRRRALRERACRARQRRRPPRSSTPAPLEDDGCRRARPGR